MLFLGVLSLVLGVVAAIVGSGSVSTVMSQYLFVIALGLFSFAVANVAGALLERPRRGNVRAT